jgi:hypothetical protein
MCSQALRLKQAAAAGCLQCNVVQVYLSELPAQVRRRSVCAVEELTLLSWASVQLMLAFVVMILVCLCAARLRLERRGNRCACCLQLTTWHLPRLRTKGGGLELEQAVVCRTEWRLRPQVGSFGVQTQYIITC